MDCEKCRAVVADVARHDQWHAELGSVAGTAKDALEKAEYANNTLYQNGIEA